MGSDDGGLRHLRVREQDLLDLPRVDVAATGDDHVARRSEATLSAEVLAAEDFGQALDMTLLYLRGLALTGTVTRSPGSQAQSLAAWKAYLLQRLVTGAVGSRAELR